MIIDLQFEVLLSKKDKSLPTNGPWAALAFLKSGGDAGSGGGGVGGLVPIFWGGGDIPKLHEEGKNVACMHHVLVVNSYPPPPPPHTHTFRNPENVTFNRKMLHLTEKTYDIGIP